MTALRFSVRSVAIIGAGPSGLAAAKYVRDQGAFSRIVIYEQNDEIGGAWNYSAQTTSAEHIPQVDPWLPPDAPIRPVPVKGVQPAPVYPTAIYDFLHTNVPHPLMGFSDLTFASVFDRTRKDAETPEGGVLTIFPRRQDVFKYLLRYGQDLRNLLRLRTTVDDVRLVESGSGSGSGAADEVRERWEVHATNTVSGDKSVDTFDAVMVANGHYDITYLPDVPGIQAFAAAHPGVVTHAQRYRKAEAFAGKKVVVVGNAASGMDIGLQINGVCKRPLILSVHSPTAPDVLDRLEGVQEVPAIAEYLADERGVRLADGRVVRDVDAVLYCTGYLFSLPFLEPTRPPERWRDHPAERPAGRLAPLLTADGRRIRDLYQDLLHIEHPTLAFLALPYKVVPFPLAEAQAAVLARTWANVLPTPSREAMRAWERAAEQERPASGFHVWALGDDGKYINATYQQIMEENGEAARVGKTPPRWTPEDMWVRSLGLEPKGRFEDTGRKALTLEDLGYVYEGDKADKADKADK